MATAAFNLNAKLIRFSLLAIFFLAFNYVFLNFEHGHQAGDIAKFFPWRCPWHLFLKIDCPGCGIIRSLIEAIRLNWISSVNYHVLGLPFLATLIFLFTQFGFKINQWWQFFDDQFKNKKLLFWIFVCGLTFNFLYKNFNFFF